MVAAFDLVLFDLGGVIVEYDDEAIERVWRDAGLDYGPALALFRTAYEIEACDSHPIHRAERGELSLAEFLALAEPMAAGIGDLCDGSRPTALQRFIRPYPAWAVLAKEVGERGIVTGVLSNTFDGFDVESLMIHNPAMRDYVVGLFGDDILESHVLGERKPSRGAYLAAAEHFDVQLERILFIDDHAPNCQGATAAGITSIHCSQGQDELAQQQARRLLHLV
jgi:putative hydrolase of the HAD superfamily